MNLSLLKNNKMKGSNEWEDLKLKDKKILFKDFIIKRIEENKDNYENGKIDTLTYSKNQFLLVHIKKNDIYKKIRNEDIILNNSLINKIEIIKTNEKGLVYFDNNKQKQIKI